MVAKVDQIRDFADRLRQVSRSKPGQLGGSVRPGPRLLRRFSRDLLARHLRLPQSGRLHHRKRARVWRPDPSARVRVQVQ